LSDIRIKKAESLIREKIGELILQGVIKDPRIDTFLSVTRVKVSKDIAYAKVYISGFGEDRSTGKAVHALNHAAGFIQAKLGKALRMRNTPKLSFFQDDSIRDGVEMVQKIEDLQIDES
jgi:ribosome-binding factor A